MSSSPSSFRKNDVKRMAQALRAAGVKIGRVELSGGKVSLIPSIDSPEEDAPSDQNSFDNILKIKK